MYFFVRAVQFQGTCSPMFFSLFDHYCFSPNKRLKWAARASPLEKFSAMRNLSAAAVAKGFKVKFFFQRCPLSAPIRRFPENITPLAARRQPCALALSSYVYSINSS